MFESQIMCDKIGNCTGYPNSCSTCRHNKGKKNHYSPDITPYRPYWGPYVYPHPHITSGPLPFRFKDKYAFDCVTPVKITMPKPRGKKC